MFSVLIRSNLLSTCSYLRQIKPSHREISILFDKFKRKPSKPLIDKTNYDLIYHFPGITLTAGWIKFKYTFGFLCAISAPIAYYFDNTGKTSLFIAYICIPQMILMVSTSRLLRSVVGKLYVNRLGDAKELLISSVDKNGRRFDKICPLNDIYVNDCGSILGKIGFANMYALDSEYKINVTSARFRDPSLCDVLFKNASLYKPIN